MTEKFSSRLGLLLAGIGMAIGTGNIWRFPRVAGKHGGLAFLVAWLVALFVWSIPLLIAEMLVGRETRKGPVGAFRDFTGESHTWLGAWIVFVTLAIMCYYSVVTGWCLRYLVYFSQGTFSTSTVDYAAVWKTFRNSGVQTTAFHLVSILVAGLIVSRGVKGGIERANKILLPSLLVMLIGLAVRALTLPGAWQGLSYLFTFKFTDLLCSRTWIEAFAQSAWSTGAGWGLLLTFAVYSQNKDSSPARDCTIIGLSNNAASMLAAFVVLPTVFALADSAEGAGQILKQGNEGLTFVSIAGLFGKISGGRIIGSVFFLALFFAALTSLISMLELGARTLMDFGLTRHSSVLIVTITGFILGTPSAISSFVFSNQDWVWSIGLLISGLMVALAVWIRGGDDCARLVFGSADSMTARLWKLCVKWVIPALFFYLSAWWLWEGCTWEGKGVAWWSPWARFTAGTVIVQCLVVAVALRLLNGRINRRLEGSRNAE